MPRATMSSTAAPALNGTSKKSPSRAHPEREIGIRRLPLENCCHPEESAVADDDGSAFALNVPLGFSPASSLCIRWVPHPWYLRVHPERTYGFFRSAGFQPAFARLAWKNAVIPTSAPRRDLLFASALAPAFDAVRHRLQGSMMQCFTA